MRTLVAIPIFNEQKYVRGVLTRVLSLHDEVLVIDDGSTDSTAEALSDFPVHVLRHARNEGYGRSMIDAFGFASARGYDWLVTMDCDEQHEPASIPSFLERAGRGDCDVVSGSRYLLPTTEGGSPPPERRRVNRIMTAEINARLSRRLGCVLTDAFCGFKAYRVECIACMRLDEAGYAFPMQFWTRAAADGLRVCELPVRLIYNDPNRSFGARLDDPDVRLKHYQDVLHRELRDCADRLPAGAVAGLCVRDRSCAGRAEPGA
jgi:dolichol-phosphate mannosyltransferase